MLEAKLIKRFQIVQNVDFNDNFAQSIINICIINNANISDFYETT